jgi:beta-galactosidase
LTLTARLATATAWAAEGLEIARLQVPLGISVALPAAGVASGRLPLDEGLLAHPWLSSPPMLSLWRALTDNDLAIPLNGRPVRSGLFRVTRTLLDRGISGSTATAVSRYTTAYGATIDHWQHVAALSDSSFRFHEHVLLDDELDDIPRLGITFATIAGFEHVSWLGLGPHETYPDRLRSGLLGRWESAVEDLTVPYLRPQENGGRARVRSRAEPSVPSRAASSPGRLAGHELTLSDEDGRRITVRTDRPMQMNVSHLRPADLESSRHDWELKARPETFVHLDVAHRGLGTAAVGPDTHPDCRVRGGEYRWSWQLDVS